MKQILDNTLKDIIQLSLNLSILYQNLSTAKAENNEEEFGIQLDYIKLVSEYEEKTYQKIDLKKDLGERLYNRFNYLLQNSDTPKELHDIIKKRFQNHINELLILNPFLSSNSNKQERDLENQAAITYQAMRDYSISTLYFFNKEIEKEQDPIIKQDLLDYYYEFIFNQKQLTPYLKEPPQQIEASGRNRCLVFNQQEKLVNSCYYQVIKESIIESITQTMQYTDEFLRDNPEQIAGQKVELAFTKASLVIASQEEKESLEFKANEQAQIVSSKSYKDILTAIEETNLISSETPTQKKKSPVNPV